MGCIHLKHKQFAKKRKKERNKNKALQQKLFSQISAPISLYENTTFPCGMTTVSLNC